jgi:hypothetical protein
MPLREPRPHGGAIGRADGSLPAPTVVTDFVKAPHRLEMGVTALGSDESWLELDSDLASDLRTKRELLAERHGEVFVELPESRLAQREVLDVVVRTLLARHPALYTRVGAGRLRVHVIGEEVDLASDEIPPLELAARLVQEDLCVMEKRADGWCLTAGAVCFPTRWPLQPQLGRPMTAIHERVPGYREELEHSANRFFDGLKRDTVYRRGNWSLLDDPTLFQPGGKLTQKPREGLQAKNAGENVWLRVEHQTLQRLPRSGAVLFGIRVHRARLDAVARESAEAERLLAAIETMAPAMQLYKSLGRVRAAAVGYLQARLRRPEAGS